MGEYPPPPIDPERKSALLDAIRWFALLVCAAIALPLALHAPAASFDGAHTTVARPQAQIAGLVALAICVAIVAATARASRKIALATALVLLVIGIAVWRQTFTSQPADCPGKSVPCVQM
jgi:hypothetical protein